MRRLKFRAWDKEHNFMYKVMRVAFENGMTYAWREAIAGEFAMHIGRSVGKEAELMQYIGINDMNGQEIYEGDIIKITFDENYTIKPSYIGKVEYGTEWDYPAFDLFPWIDCEMNAFSWLKSESDPSVKKYEVIGNIFENPELL